MRKNEVSNLNFSNSLVILVSLTLMLIAPFQTSAEQHPITSRIIDNVVAPHRTTPQTGFASFPFDFEVNRGQSDASVKFLSHHRGYTLFLTNTGAVFQVRNVSGRTPVEKRSTNESTQRAGSDVVTMIFAGANESPQIEGANRLTSVSNYYRGNDPSQWLENVPHFAGVSYKNIYQGVDVMFYTTEGELEYDFLVAPNTNPQSIKLRFDGADKVGVNANGSLSVETVNNEIVLQEPMAYQLIGGVRRDIACRYRINHDQPSQVFFELGDYDESKTLVVDPRVSYLTYIGGSLFDEAEAIAADNLGNLYVSGSMDSIDFPTANSRKKRDGSAVFVAKLDPTGQSLIYNTFLDGEANDGTIKFNDTLGTDIAVDANGNAFVAGTTESDRFPVSANAYQDHRSRCDVLLTPNQCRIGNQEVFVTKLNSSGQISYSTYLGGQRADLGNGIAIDSAGKAYVTGTTASGLTFPKKNKFQGTGVFGAFDDVFLTVFNAAGSDIVYSTGFGGNREDQGFGIALDSSNNAYITGTSKSDKKFPTRNAFQAANRGGKDAFIAKFNPAASGDASLIYSTLVGGSGTELAQAIAVSPDGKAVVTGVTGSFNFPLKNAIDSTNQINEVFVTQLNANGSLANSTFLGGNAQETGRGIALDPSGAIYVVGDTSSTDFPMVIPFQATLAGASDAFVTKLRFTFSSGGNPAILSSSYLGGAGKESALSIVVANRRVVFVAGISESTNLPTTPNVFQRTSTDIEGDGFAAKILNTRQDTIGVFSPSNTVFSFKNSLAGGAPDFTVDRGSPGDLPIVGDFNGDDVDTASTFNNGAWILRNSVITLLDNLFPPIAVNFGQAGDLPITGDWNGDGLDTVGVFRPSTGQFFLTNSILANPPVDFTIQFGVAEDLPVAGDWNGDGIDTVGVFRPSVATFFLTNQNVGTPSIDITAPFGVAEDLPIAGDFDGNGIFTIGVWRPSLATFFLTNDNASIVNSFVFGQNGDRPLVGNWDGKPNP